MVALAFGLALLPLALAGTYYIDPSCDSHRSEIEDGIQGAFAMARSASSAVHRQPLDQETQNNVQNLFGNVAANTAVNYIKAVLSGGRAASGHDVAGVLSYDSPRPADSFDSLTEKDVIFYCNEDRLQEKADRFNDEKRLVDTDILRKLGQYVAVPSGCPQSPLSRDIFMAAWTYTYSKGRLSTGMPSQITLCPSWLLYQQMKRWKTAANAVTKIADKVNGWQGRAGRTINMQNFRSLLDVTILHELTHTGEGGMTSDVAGDNSYGWKNCRQLALAPSTNKPKEEAVNNAESYELFAESCYINAAGLSISPEGDLVA